jgi:hypothetical protein
VNGSLSVTKAPLTATADNKTKVYGAANPPLTISYNGFIGNDGPANITAPTISTTATTSSAVGSYPISLSGGTATNYTLSLTNGTLSVTKATLNCTADLKWIYKGQSTPTFTSTITGWVTGGANAITSGPTHSISPSCTGIAGVYTITPSNLVLASPGNYQINYVTGKYYIDPKGSGAQKLLVEFECADTLIGDPSGMHYIAHLEYHNDNATPVYVPVGTNNNMTGTYAGVINTVFAPGINYVDLPFNGSNITWTVKSYNGSTLSTSSVTGNQTDRYCEDWAGIRVFAPKGNASSDTYYKIYPNPVADVINLETNNGINLNECRILVTDVMGRNFDVAVDRIGSTKLMMNVSTLSSGIYMIKISDNDHAEVFNIIKQ